MAKILQLGKFYPIKGGVEKVMQIFTEGLSERGYHCDMLCASCDGQTEDILLSDHARILRTKSWVKLAATMVSPQMIWRLRRICRQYDIIHIHHPDPMATLALYLSGYKGKVILHWHSDILKQRTLLQFFRPLQSWLIRRSDLILGTSPIYVEQSPWLQGVQHKVSHLPIGVDPHPWLADEVQVIREQYEGKKIVFNMGRLVPYKGYHHLVEAAQLLGEDYVVLIGGDGPLRTELQQKIDALGIGARVRLLGFIPQELKAAYFGACDVFCLSSILRTEAYAIVQVEAMSLARPVVATSIPGSGVPWVNQHDISGLNVPIGDAHALADAIRRICESPELWLRYSDGARKRYLDVFTKDEVINKLIEIYTGILTNNQPKAHL